jgi:hypothetical protein
MGTKLHLFLLLLLLASHSAVAAAQASVEDCLAAFPAVFTLQTEFSLMRVQRLSRAHELLAVKHQDTLESVATKLSAQVQSLRQNDKAQKLERARAEFAHGAYAEAQVLALEAGDEAHRSAARRPEQVISALELAAFAALEQRHFEEAVKFLSVAATHLDSTAGGHRTCLPADADEDT